MVKCIKPIKSIVVNTTIKYGVYIPHENGIDYFHETVIKPGFHVRRIDRDTGEHDNTIIIFKTEKDA